MTPSQIAIKEKINEARAKQAKYANWERQLTHRAYRLMQAQARLEDRIIVLEYDLAMDTKAQTMAESDKMWEIKRFLKEVGL